MLFNHRRLQDWAYTAQFSELEVRAVRSRLLRSLEQATDAQGDFEVPSDVYRPITAFLRLRNDSLSDNARLAFDVALTELINSLLRHVPAPAAAADE